MRPHASKTWPILSTPPDLCKTRRKSLCKDIWHLTSSTVDFIQKCIAYCCTPNEVGFLVASLHVGKATDGKGSISPKEQISRQFQFACFWHPSTSRWILPTAHSQAQRSTAFQSWGFDPQSHGTSLVTSCVDEFGSSSWGSFGCFLTKKVQISCGPSTSSWIMLYVWALNDWILEFCPHLVSNLKMFYHGTKGCPTGS